MVLSPGARGYQCPPAWKEKERERERERGRVGGWEGGIEGGREREREGRDGKRGD